MNSVPPTGTSRADCRLLGVSVTPFTLDGLLTRITFQISSGLPATIVGHNLHSSYLYHSNPALRDFYDRADIVLSDGAPVLWDYRLSPGSRPNQRLGSTDWIPQLSTVEGLRRVLVIGASEDSNARCVERLQALLGDASVHGVPGAGWNEVLEDRTLGTIRTIDPQLILVGLGMPLQEFFADAIRASGSTATIATVGGAIDQLSGEQRNAPRWLGRFGLEWLWRFTTQPKRLWRRYLVEPWALLLMRIRSGAGKGMA